MSKESIYEVYWIGGDKDGVVLDTFTNYTEAVKYVTQMLALHEDEFDPCYGGIGISEDGNPMEW